MKTTLILSLFAAIILPLTISAQTDYDFRTDWEKDGLKGKVKKVSTQYNDQDPSIKTYNTLGYVIEIVNDLFSTNVKNTYDKDKITMSQTFDANGSVNSTTTYEYNNKGQRMSYTTKSKYGTTIGKYEYNSDKTLKSYARFDGGGDKYRYLVEPVYKNGILVEENQYGPDRTPYIWAVYNDKGQCTEYKKWRRSGELRIHGRYLYDNSGFLIEWDSMQDGIWQLYYKYENDQFGNHISETPGKDGSVRSYKYEYDSHGNWTKKVEYSNGSLYSTETRIIEYY